MGLYLGSSRATRDLEAGQQFFLSLVVSLTSSRGTQVPTASTFTLRKKPNLRRHRWKQAESVLWCRSQAWPELRSFRLSPSPHTGSLPALPPSSGYLEQIHGVGTPDLGRAREGEEQRVREEGWWEQCRVRGVPSSRSRAPPLPKPPFINSFRGGSC